MRQDNQWFLSCDIYRANEPRKTYSLIRNGWQVSCIIALALVSVLADIEACSSSLCGNVELHLIHIDVRFCLASLSTIFLARLFLCTHLVYFRDQGSPQRRSEPENETQNSLLERLASRVNVVQTADFDDQLEGTLPHFCVLVHAPLTGKLSELLIVLPDHNLEGSLVKFLSRLNQQ